MGLIIYPNPIDMELWQSEYLQKARFVFDCKVIYKTLFRFMLEKIAFDLDVCVAMFVIPMEAKPLWLYTYVYVWVKCHRILLKC